ncbi:hypothetical protein, partial [Stenomitos frigidus]
GGLRQPMHASNYSDFTHQLKIDRPLALDISFSLLLVPNLFQAFCDRLFDFITELVIYGFNKSAFSYGLAAL